MQEMKKNCFLVTGAQGFIGSWIIKNLLENEQEIVAFDVDDQPVRLSCLVGRRTLKKIRFIRGDVNDMGLIKRLIGENSVSRVIHLAGLQTPDCKARPVLGATVNLVGTLSVFEAVKAFKHQVGCIVYASSGAVLGSDEQYTHPIPDEAPRIPDPLRCIQDDQRGMRPDLLAG